MPWQNCSLMPLEKAKTWGRKTDLRPFNTFGISVQARCLVPVHSVVKLKDLLAERTGPVRILGGGSNILLTKEVEDILLRNEIKGMEVVARDDNSAIVKVGGGENWHDFVGWCLDHDFGGVENLSLIPGTAGAAPIQNIGAYGVELKDVFHQLSAVRLSDGQARIFSHSDCAFGYRDSIFKNRLKGQYFISHVYLKLTVKDHQINMDYGAIRDRLKEWGIEQADIRGISKAVVSIRQQKLPDPALLGNAGSFFKNPVLPAATFEKLQKRFPDMVHYRVGKDQVKVPAGWLIERCGWKGKRVGDVGCYEKQALVIVNYKAATGEEIWSHAERVMESVWAVFGVRLQPEVNVW
jgi:UDP-N-acetylmuramate dehydrogenase